MRLPSRGRLFCMPVTAVLIFLRLPSDPLALPHIFMLTSSVISLVPSRSSLALNSCSTFWHRDPLCVPGGSNLTAELAYGNHPSVAPHAVGVHQSICADVVHGRALVFTLSSAFDIGGLGISPSAVVLSRSPVLFTISRLLERAAIPALTTIPSFPPTPPASSAMCFGVCCYG